MGLEYPLAAMRLSVIYCYIHQEKNCKQHVLVINNPRTDWLTKLELVALDADRIEAVCHVPHFAVTGRAISVNHRVKLINNKIHYFTFC